MLRLIYTQTLNILTESIGKNRGGPIAADSELKKGKCMIKNIIKVLAGLLMIVSVLIGYIPQPEYLIELTCISNTLGGLLLFADGILGMAKKKICFNSLYLNVTASIVIVFLICAGSLFGSYNFNFSGAFFFLHIINPIIFVCFYVIFVNEQGRKMRCVLAAPAMTMAYLLFDYVRYRFKGEFVYGFIENEEFTLAWVIVAAIITYAFIYLLSLSLFALNRFVHKRKKQSGFEVVNHKV